MGKLSEYVRFLNSEDIPLVRDLFFMSLTDREKKVRAAYRKELKETLALKGKVVQLELF